MVNIPPSTPSDITSPPAAILERARNAKGHRSTCTCTLCKRIQARIAAGQPTIAERNAIAAAKRTAKQLKLAQSQNNSKKKLSATEASRLATNAAIEAAVATQVQLGHAPNIAQAARAAGIEPRTGQLRSAVNNFVQAALERVGINDARLAEVAANALEATDTRVVYRNGEPETFDVPDWGARHKFWRDILLAKKILGNESEGATAATLVVVSPQAAQSVTGHDPSCKCDQCIQSWQNRVEEFTTEQARRTAIDAELIDEIDALGAENEDD